MLPKPLKIRVFLEVKFEGGTLGRWCILWDVRFSMKWKTNFWLLSMYRCCILGSFSVRWKISATSFVYYQRHRDCASSASGQVSQTRRWNCFTTMKALVHQTCLCNKVEWSLSLSAKLALSFRSALVLKGASLLARFPPVLLPVMNQNTNPTIDKTTSSSS